MVAELRLERRKIGSRRGRELVRGEWPGVVWRFRQIAGPDHSTIGSIQPGSNGEEMYFGGSRSVRRPGGGADLGGETWRAEGVFPTVDGASTCTCTCTLWEISWTWLDQDGKSFSECHLGPDALEQVWTRRDGKDLSAYYSWIHDDNITLTDLLSRPSSTFGRCSW